MKSSAFAHPTVVPEPLVQREEGTGSGEAGHQGAPGERPGPGAPKRRLAPGSQEAGNQAVGARSARRGEEARASEVPRGARGGAQYRPRPCLPLARSPGHPPPRPHLVSSLPAPLSAPRPAPRPRPFAPLLRVPVSNARSTLRSPPQRNCLLHRLNLKVQHHPKLPKQPSLLPAPSHSGSTPASVASGPRTVPGGTLGGAASHRARHRGPGGAGRGCSVLS